MLPRGKPGGVTRFVLLFALAAPPAAAQFRYIKIWFAGTGCESCTQSMPDRARRLRGVESAKVDAREGTLEIELAASNRVRLEQVRDLIQQDGTKATRAAIRASGEVSQEEGRWILKLTGVASTYELHGPNLAAGTAILSGEAAELNASPGRISIQVSQIKK